jgi:BirA family biotin operon repressor/biotin-[acetyl-CoA-carboxylase] ligase
VILELDSVASTQEEAKARAKEGCAHGVVVVAVEQTAGRGRRGRTWASGDHGLWLSMVLRTSTPMSRASRLSLCACDAVATVLEKAGARVHVKWPNDIMIASTGTSSMAPHPTLGPFRKAGGLLIEAVDVDASGPRPATLRTAILGIGLNLTRPAGGFPAEIAASAGSLDDAGLVLGRLELATRLREGLMNVDDGANDDGDFARVRSRLARASATLGRRVCVDGIEGLAVGFDDDGALQIEGAGGELHTVHAGDVMLA